MKAQILLKNIRWQGGHNPTFKPRETRTAIAELLNPTASILPYRGEIFLSPPEPVTKIARSGTIFFNIDAGKTKKVNFPITMPTVAGTYIVHLEVFSDNLYILSYQADEKVIIAEPTRVMTEAAKLTESVLAAATAVGAGTTQEVLEQYLAYMETVPGLPTPSTVEHWTGFYPTAETIAWLEAGGRPR